jgi:hypothetical protein
LTSPIVQCACVINKKLWTVSEWAARVHEQHYRALPPRPGDWRRRGDHCHLSLPNTHTTATTCTWAATVSQLFFYFTYCTVYTQLSNHFTSLHILQLKIVEILSHKIKIPQAPQRKKSAKMSRELSAAN